MPATPALPALPPSPSAAVTPPTERPQHAAAAPPPPGAPDTATFVRRVRQGIEQWVAAAVESARTELGSSAQVHAVAGDREHTAPALAALRNDGLDLVRRITQAVRTQLDASLAGPGAADGTAAAGSGGEDGRADGGLTLQLIDEAQVDEEIETARIVSLVEDAAEAELQQLNALCSGLRRLGHVDPKAAPLTPAVIARGLRQALSGWPGAAPTRLLLLRLVGAAVGRQMRGVYAEQARLLLGWGVRPASFRVVPTAPARPAAGSAAARDDGASPQAPDARDAMHRLVAWARAATAPAPLDEPASAGQGDALSLRLFGEPVDPSRLRTNPLGGEAAGMLMDRLFEQLEQQARTQAGAQPLLDTLRQAGQRLAASDPQLWDNPSHPWWKLVDALLAAGSLQDGLPARHQDRLNASLQQVVSRLAGPESAAPAQTHGSATAAEVSEAALAVREVASRFLEEQAPEWVEPARVLQQQADREELELALRNQIVQQLRCTPVCPGLRQFLLGPWVMAMAHVAATRGEDSRELADLALVVDDLIRATSQPGTRVSRPQCAVLLRQVEAGLQHGALPASRIGAELADLEALLKAPPPVPTDAAELPDEPPPIVPVAHVLDLHAALPTVPLEMGDGATPEPHRNPEAWAATLQPPGFCRLFLQGRWMSAQLMWISDTGNLFLFKSRHGGRSHSLTRRMLLKLRAAGLATSIDDGYLVAQALDSMVHSELGPA